MFALSVSFAATTAHAQMQLPGAVGGSVGAEGPQHDAGSPSSGNGGAGGTNSGSPPYVPPKPIAMTAPDEASIVKHSLSADGMKGEMVFDKSGNDLVLLKLGFVGGKISKPGQACSVEVPLPAPLRLIPAGRPSGTIRYGVPLQDCPFTIDILDGAVLVTRDAQAVCEIASSDCQVSPDGLWGPHSTDISPKQTKELERERVRFETTMRANFHALIRKAGKDHAAVKAIAKDQAAFSSEREMTCRDYADETVHGFCSTQVTQARALALLAQFGPLNAIHEHKQARHIKPKDTADKAAVSSGQPPNLEGQPPQAK